MTMTAETRRALAALLAHQIELGADEAIAEAPLDRFAETAREREAAKDPRPPSAAPAPGPRAPASGPRAPAAPAAPAATPGAAAADVPGARALAEAAATLEELAAAMAAWEGSELRHGARNLVFADGLPGARLMVVGEAPGSEEDRLGKPFVGRAGQLLDRMLAAIGLDRHAEDPAGAAYITNILPWRPLGNRTPSEAEVQAFLPFAERHIALARPEIVLALGGTAAKALLGTATGIRRLRGAWMRHGATGLPLLPSLHPAYLLRQPAEKRHAWRDLLAIRAALDGAEPPL